MGQELGPDDLKLRLERGEELVKRGVSRYPHEGSLPLSPVTIAAHAGTISIELRTQGVQMVP